LETEISFNLGWFLFDGRCFPVVVGVWAGRGLERSEMGLEAILVAFEGGSLSTPTLFSTQSKVNARQAGISFLQGMDFPTFPTKETSMRFLGNSENQEKIKCLFE